MSRLLTGVASLLGLGLASLVPASCGLPCDDKTYYGPPPCQSDQECIDAHSDDADSDLWYCDTDYVVDQACDATWATCVKGQ